MIRVDVVQVVCVCCLHILHIWKIMIGGRITFWNVPYAIPVNFDRRRDIHSHCVICTIPWHFGSLMKTHDNCPPHMHTACMQHAPNRSSSFIHMDYRLVSILTLCMKCDSVANVQIIVFLPQYLPLAPDSPRFCWHFLAASRTTIESKFVQNDKTCIYMRSRAQIDRDSVMCVFCATSTMVTSDSDLQPL